MTGPAIRTAGTAEVERVVGVLTLAFGADPGIRWLFPDPQQYLTSFPRLVRALGGKAFEHGTAEYAGEFAGAALWLPPGVEPDEEALGSLFESSLRPEQLPRVFATLEQLGRCHPAEPYWYLPFIGVDLPRQGQGFGTALLSHALERIDRERRPAFLETTNPANVPLYQRHGFELMGKIGEEPVAFTMYPMIRPAR